ncbi:MAG: fibronectin type III domain-containing protein [Myxococcales bacterium]|nr:fibronectin type III domain-containing protein [Myxococcales bacterium]
MKAALHLAMTAIAVTCVCILAGCGGGGGGGGNGGGSAPAAPSNLHSTAQTANTITLAWNDNANNETGFSIERLNGTTWTVLTTTGANVVTYVDSSLTPSTNYSYRVRAVNNYGTSAYTAVLQTATGVDTTKGTVTGTVVNLVGSAAISGVTVKLGTTLTTTTGTTGTYTFTGVTPGTYALTVSHASYTYYGAAVQVNVTAGQTTTVPVIKMSSDSEGPPPPPF